MDTRAVAKFVLGIMRNVVPAGTTLRAGEINGQPGFIVYLSGRALSALIFDVRGGRIRTIYAAGNPEKLQALPGPLR